MSRLTVSRQRIIQAAIDLFARHGSARLTVSQLAEAAGVTRATIYNNGLHPQTLFQDVCLSLKREMDQRMEASLQGVDDPPRRLIQAVHFYLRRAHEEPQWARFFCTFAYNPAMMAELESEYENPLADFHTAIARQRYQLSEVQIMAALGMVGGTMLSGMFLVLEGRQTWREASSHLSLLLLRALGLNEAEITILLAEPLLDLLPIID